MYKKPLKLTLVFFMLLFTTTAFSQSKSNSAATEGTFQLITSNPKIKEVFTTDLLVQIEAARKQNEVTYLKVSMYTKAKILPYRVINAPDFKPIQELYTTEQ